MMTVNKQDYNAPVDNTNIICMWDKLADCVTCNINLELNCKWDKKLLTGFLVGAFSYMIIGLLGMVVTGILTGVWWPIIAIIAFLPIFFIFIEIRVLCSHCPFYAEDSTILHCLANHGVPKLWGYRPEPLNTVEKIIFLVGALFFGAFPFITQIYGIWVLVDHFEAYDIIALLGLIGIALATLLAALTFFSSLIIHYCPKCVNFSCPLNRVPKSLINNYLERNPIMKAAWEQSGYKFG